jgi:DNA-binding GntR family transcriptional regulator
VDNDSIPDANAPGAAQRDVPTALANQLQAQIQDGRLQPGRRLPQPAALAQRHGTDRDTAVKALGVLRARGYARWSAGDGMVAARPPGATAPAAGQPPA